MDYPEGKDTFFAPAEFDSLRDATLKQIEKDFLLQGIEITLTDEGQTYADLVSGLSIKLDELQLLGSGNLQSLLYQLDISEKFVREEITGKKEESALLADAIIRRCFAKVVYRKKYS